jgi:hypothetical protein
VSRTGGETLLYTDTPVAKPAGRCQTCVVTVTALNGLAGAKYIRLYFSMFLY